MENEKIITYADVLASFGERKVAERFDNLQEQLRAFIARKKYDEKVVVCSNVLQQMIIDYFTDIYRLKEFHHIDLTNQIKITAYTAYWLARRKPLQILKDDSSDMELTFCNENFVLSYILRFLLGDLRTAVNDPDGRFGEFIKNLSYFLRYRTLTPQMLELMLESFKGGYTFRKNL